MKCDEYIERFLSAHADGQLSAAERSLVEEHLQHCHGCRTRLVEENALKAEIRRFAGSDKAPADVRLRIRAALGEAIEREPLQLASAGRSSFREGAHRRIAVVRTLRRTAERAERVAPTYRPGSARTWLALQLKRAQYLAPVGVLLIVLAGTLMLFRVDVGGLAGPSTREDQRTVPAFDFAIDRFNQLTRQFAPNVPAEAFNPDNGAYFAWVEESHPIRHVSTELPDISASYEKMQMLPELCDFALAGYQLVGGRIDHLPNGTPVTYTLYRNPTGSILSIGLKQQISAPEGGYWFGTHVLYDYRDYSICLTIDPVGHFASLIVARGPMVDLLRDVAASDIAMRDR